MTYRERMERRAERRREWADKRDQKAIALRSATPRELRHDIAFLTQPGDIPERRRMYERDRRAFEHHKMAEHHDEKAATIERQLDRSIYDDDHDAIERIEEKIAALETERERIKAYNRTARKGQPDPKMLREKEAERVAFLIQIGQSRKGEYPAYVLQNLGSQIRRYRERLETIKARQQRQAIAEDAGGISIQTDGDYCRITFAEVPPRETREALKAAGYRYRKGSWMGKTDRLPEDIQTA